VSKEFRMKVNPRVCFRIASVFFLAGLVGGSSASGFVAGESAGATAAARPVATALQQAPPNDISRAEFFLKKLEDRAQRMQGQPFKMGYDETQALERIKALKEKYPNDPKVDAMFKRAQAAVMGSKGDFIEVTPDMLTFRQNEKKLKDLFAQEGEKQWAAFKKDILASPGVIAKAFPPPSVRDESVEKLKGRYVILDEFEYPTNEFTEGGQQYVFAGSGARGYYWVEIANRAWIGPYEAIRRYKRQINQDVPEGGKWTVVGRVTGVRFLVPQAEKKKTMSAFWGWCVEPVAIYVPGVTFALAAPSLESGGAFAGEENLERIKAPLYSVRAVPPDASPERVVEIFAAAIKEKNLELYRECIDPRRQTGPRASSLLMYHWDWHQYRFANFYVHITVDKAKVRVLKGFDQGNRLEDFFLSSEQKEAVKKISEDLVEEATVFSKAFDERGRQYGSPKPHFLRRVGGSKGRWYITNFPQPF
jgi:hypothetical protein